MPATPACKSSFNYKSSILAPVTFRLSCSNLKSTHSVAVIEVYFYGKLSIFALFGQRNRNMHKENTSNDMQEEKVEEKVEGLTQMKREKKLYQRERKVHTSLYRAGRSTRGIWYMEERREKARGRSGMRYGARSTTEKKKPMIQLIQFTEIKREVIK